MDANEIHSGPLLSPVSLTATLSACPATPERGQDDGPETAASARPMEVLDQDRVAVIYTEDGTNVNPDMIRAGYP